MSFNGQTITYDQMGNPTTYLGATLSWENIRQLASYVKGNTNVSYTYNADGIRTSKTVSGVTHTYALEGTRIILETYGTVLIVYLYDEAGSPIGLAYRDSATADTTLDKEEQFTYYLFTKNLQGDIISIYNEQGQIVTLYRYDAWGNHTVHNWTDDNIGNINPFRYRGYYYDTDTGFYYLNSRYYDPQVKRFINADDISYLGANGDWQGFNLYAYCSNNPVMYADPSGEVSEILIAICFLVAISTLICTYLDCAGIDETDSIHNEVYKKDDNAGFTERDLYCDVEVDEFMNTVSGIDAEFGVVKGVIEEDDITTTSKILSVESSIKGLGNMVGFGVGAYIASLQSEIKFDAFGRKITLGGRVNCGVGATAMVGMRTEIGFSNGIGASFFLDID